MYDEFRYYILNQVFNIAGMFVSNQLTRPNYEEQEKLTSQYYGELKEFARAEGLKGKPELNSGETASTYVVVKDPRKTERGTACLPCSKHHFSTASAMLNEAIRFAREKDMSHEEIQRRIGIATDELNAAERGDLHADQLEKLPPIEKEVAEDALKKLRELRHDMDHIMTKKDLEEVAAKAANIRTELMRKIWEITTKDGTIEKLCKGLKDDELERCTAAINVALKEKAP